MSIVIIGSNVAGITAIGTIFKEIQSSGQKSKYSITVVSKSSHIYGNPTAPRLLVEPQHADKVFFSVENYLKNHSKGVKYEFIHSSVDKTDFNSKILTLSSGKELKYDYLIIASGSHAESPAFKLHGDYLESKKAIKEVNKSIQDSGSIAILGGGATGVETASEIAYSFPKKKVTLFTGAEGPLSAIGKSIPASKKLEKLGIKIVNKKRFSSIDSTDTGASVITFADGSSETFDFYLPTYGVYPNSDFLDSKYLDDNGYLIVDKNLAVRGHSDVIALGDVASITENSIVDIKFQQTKVFTQTVKKTIFKKDVKLVDYSRGKTTTLIPISKNGGVGLMFGWSVPNFLVKQIKSKDFMISQVGKDYI
ncbi:apoptosis-inducing factor 1 [[Candida] railenensis]|uniref:Apoptosis-inducing factor 1 n=1 Tax=[Candida] railenensis TaxID=45579 RepID=A0A9P0QKX3_9ASCO|nr:apoptosis-inducing factor 1 [[Candida] railenensis]